MFATFSILCQGYPRRDCSCFGSECRAGILLLLNPARDLLKWVSGPGSPRNPDQFFLVDHVIGIIDITQCTEIIAMRVVTYSD